MQIQLEEYLTLGNLRRVAVFVAVLVLVVLVALLLPLPAFRQSAGWQTTQTKFAQPTYNRSNREK